MPDSDYILHISPAITATYTFITIWGANSYKKDVKRSWRPRRCFFSLQNAGPPSALAHFGMKTTHRATNAASKTRFSTVSFDNERCTYSFLSILDTIWGSDPLAVLNPFSPLLSRVSSPSKWRQYSTQMSLSVWNNPLQQRPAWVFQRYRSGIISPETVFNERVKVFNEKYIFLQCVTNYAQWSSIRFTVRSWRSQSGGK